MSLPHHTRPITLLAFLTLLLAACQTQEAPGDTRNDPAPLEQLNVMVEDYDGPAQDASLLATNFPQFGTTLVAEGQISASGRLIIDLGLPPEDALQPIDDSGEIFMTIAVHLGDTNGSGGTIIASTHDPPNNIEAGDHLSTFIYATRAMTLTGTIPPIALAPVTTVHQDLITLDAGWNFRRFTILNASDGNVIAESETADPAAASWRYHAP